MDDPKKSEAALRANENDCDTVDEDESTPVERKPTPAIAESSAEGGPELRDLDMPEGVDRPDGSRKP